MDDSEEKRKQEAYTHFAEIAMQNSKAYEGSGNIDKKLKRIESIIKGLREINYKSVFQKESCDEMLLSDNEHEEITIDGPKLIKK